MKYNKNEKCGFITKILDIYINNMKSQQAFIYTIKNEATKNDDINEFLIVSNEIANKYSMSLHTSILFLLITITDYFIYNITTTDLFDLDKNIENEYLLLKHIKKDIMEVK